MRKHYKEHKITAVGDLFAVYRRRLQAPQKTVVKEVVVVVNEVTGILVQEKHFSYNVHTKTVTCNTPSAIRTEVHLYRSEILRRLKDRLGEKSAPTGLQ